MRLPKSKAAKAALLVLLVLIAVPAVALAYFQTLDPPAGVASATDLRVPQPSEHPTGMGAGVQLTAFTQAGPQDGPGL